MPLGWTPSAIASCFLWKRTYTGAPSATPPPIASCPAAKGDSNGWERVRHSPQVILVEGLFDLAVLWQAGFRNATCALGSHLNARQLRQLCDGVPRTLYLAFDSDANGAGQQAAQRLSW